jgi:hypothetical protein
MIHRVLWLSFGALLLGSTAAFLLFVPLLSIVTVACMLVSLMLMFALGFQLGTQNGWRPIYDRLSSPDHI